jgi:hypothetical protein
VASFDVPEALHGVDLCPAVSAETGEAVQMNVGGCSGLPLAFPLEGAAPIAACGLRPPKRERSESGSDLVVPESQRLRMEHSV